MEKEKSCVKQILNSLLGTPNQLLSNVVPDELISSSLKKRQPIPPIFQFNFTALQLSLLPYNGKSYQSLITWFAKLASSIHVCRVWSTEHMQVDSSEISTVKAAVSELLLSIEQEICLLDAKLAGKLSHNEQFHSHLRTDKICSLTLIQLHKICKPWQTLVQSTLAMILSISPDHVTPSKCIPTGIAKANAALSKQEDAFLTKCEWILWKGQQLQSFPVSTTSSTAPCSAPSPTTITAEHDAPHSLRLSLYSVSQSGFYCFLKRVYVQAVHQLLLAIVKQLWSLDTASTQRISSTQSHLVEEVVEEVQQSKIAWFFRELMQNMESFEILAQYSSSSLTSKTFLSSQIHGKPKKHLQSGQRKGKQAFGATQSSAKIRFLNLIHDQTNRFLSQLLSLPSFASSSSSSSSAVCTTAVAVVASSPLLHYLQHGLLCDEITAYYDLSLRTKREEQRVLQGVDGQWTVLLQRLLQDAKEGGQGGDQKDIQAKLIEMQGHIECLLHGDNQNHDNNNNSNSYCMNNTILQSFFASLQPQYPSSSSSNNNHNNHNNNSNQYLYTIQTLLQHTLTTLNTTNTTTTTNTTNNSNSNNTNHTVAPLHSLVPFDIYLQHTYLTPFSIELTSLQEHLFTCLHQQYTLSNHLTFFQTLYLLSNLHSQTLFQPLQTFLDLFLPSPATSTSSTTSSATTSHRYSQLTRQAMVQSHVLLSLQRSLQYTLDELRPRADQGMSYLLVQVPNVTDIVSDYDHQKYVQHTATGPSTTNTRSITGKDRVIRPPSLSTSSSTSPSPALVNESMFLALFHTIRFDVHYPYPLSVLFPASLLTPLHSIQHTLLSLLATKWLLQAWWKCLLSQTHSVFPAAPQSTQAHLLRRTQDPGYNAILELDIQRAKRACQHSIYVALHCVQLLHDFYFHTVYETFWQGEVLDQCFHLSAVATTTTTKAMVFREDMTLAKMRTALHRFASTTHAFLGLLGVDLLYLLERIHIACYCLRTAIEQDVDTLGQPHSQAGNLMAYRVAELAFEDVLRAKEDFVQDALASVLYSKEHYFYNLRFHLPKEFLHLLEELFQLFQ